MRVRYSERTANKPGMYDSIRNESMPLQTKRDRNSQIIRDRSLTPVGQEEPDPRRRSYIRPDKNIKSHPVRESRVDQKLMNQKQPAVKKNAFHNCCLPLFKPDEKKRDALYKAAQSRPKPAINRQSSANPTLGTPTTAGRIDARRQTVPVVSERPNTRDSRTPPPNMKRRLSAETRSPVFPIERARTPYRHAATDRVVQPIPVPPSPQSREIRREEQVVRHAKTTTPSTSRVTLQSSSSRIGPVKWTDEDENLITEEHFTSRAMDSAVRRNKPKILATVKIMKNFEPTTRIRAPQLRFRLERFKAPTEIVTIDSD